MHKYQIFGMLVGLLAVFSGMAQQPGAGQMSDFISVKTKNGRHLASYFKGSHLQFRHVNGQEIDGFIEDVRHDSVFVRQWQVQSYISALGTTKVDTMGYYIHRMHFQEIAAIETNRKESWGFVRNGSIFMIAGLGYALLNVINGAYLHEPLGDPANTRSLLIAAGVTAGGFVLNRIHHRKRKSGNQYKIEYINMTNR